jgi:peptidoglycan/xylan/chitin deacetylase (PgdA/CDA1 family)
VYCIGPRLRLAAVPSGMTFPGAAPPAGTDGGHSPRHVVITIDDLPKTMGSESLASATRVTEAILDALGKHHAPSLGFVIGNKVFMKGDPGL